MSKTKPYTIDSAPDERHIALAETLDRLRSATLLIGASAAKAVKAVIPLGVRVPEPIHEAAARLLVVSDRAAELTRTPAVEFTAEDLAADDWRDRLDRSATARARTPEAQKLVDEAVRGAHAALGAACARELPAVGDELERWFVDNLAELARADLEPEPADTYGTVTGRNAALVNFTKAHGRLMVAGGGQPTVDNAAWTWWRTHTWTRAEWSAILDRTGPNATHHGPNPLALAVQIGGTPRLARSESQAWEDYRALIEGQRADAFEEVARTPGSFAVIGASW